MNAAAMIRRFEAGGFTHEQAVCLAETLTDEVESTVATREFVEAAIERANARLVAEDLNPLRRDFAEDLNALRRDFTEELHALRREMATKDDIREMATKDDIRRLEARIDDLAQRMATKEYVLQMMAELDAKFAVRLNEQTRWFAGIAIVQTVAILGAAITLVQVLG